MDAERTSDLIAQLTLDEKIALCSGRDMWHTVAIDRLGIPSALLTDGPHGVRKQRDDHQALHPATAFPVAAGQAASWNRELIRRVGEVMGTEARALDVAVVLGPGVNIKRSPLGGRNFEYYSEDPFLSSELATAHVLGVQSRGVGSCLKHFAMNNQEHRRMSVDVRVDARTMREIYLASFERAVRNARPWSVMCAYNRINGTYASDHRELLNDILRQEWGFSGFVVSDWGAVNERDRALAAGLDLEMPCSHGFGARALRKALDDGSLRVEQLDIAVHRVLNMVREVRHASPAPAHTEDEHHAVALDAARESIVLLKNDDRALPLRPAQQVAFLGAQGVTPRYQGGGSSMLKPTRLSSAWRAAEEIADDGALRFAPGYRTDSDDTDAQLLREAVDLASTVDTAVLFLGLSQQHESESYDRDHLRLPPNHLALLDAVTRVQPNTIVVLTNGSPVEMPWLDKVSGVVEAYVGGQAGGQAVAEVLYGEVNPSGRLAETFPVKLSDTPAFLNFPGDNDVVEYREGVFVGYRYYDKKEIAPLFPFGFGLSYTEFEFSELSVSATEIDEHTPLEVAVTVRNVGDVAGKEVVQLYVRDVESSVTRPPWELREFAKVDLAPGESRRVPFTLDRRAFAHFNTEIDDWYVETGEFQIAVGHSSRDLVLSESVTVRSDRTISRRVDHNTTVSSLLNAGAKATVTAELMSLARSSELAIDPEDTEETARLLAAMMRDVPLRTLPAFTQGQVGVEQVDALIAQLNRELDEQG